MEGVVHGVIAGHLVQQPDLQPVADPESPVDRGVLVAGAFLDQRRAHVRRSGEPVDLDHVVFALDATRGGVVVTCVRMVVRTPGKATA
jgi:hypothetical protein